jgi:hypothetical protein
MRSNPLTDYIKWLIGQIHDVQKYQSVNYPYKIVSKELCKKTGEEKLIIQVAGKNVFLRLSPQELVRDEAALRSFSPLDVRNITYLACNLENLSKKGRPFYKIVSQFFSHTRQEEMFVIQAENSTAQITKSAQDISSDPELINNFNTQDAHKIGHIAGSEQVAMETDILNKEKFIPVNNIREKKTIYKIVAQFFSRRKKQEMFVIQAEGEIARTIQSAQDISADPVLISKLASEDAHKIGYVSGAEQIAIENEMLKNANQS